MPPGNYNGHGLGGRTEGMRYYGMRGPEDRPHGMAFYGTEAALFVDRIGMELYPEPKPPEGGGRGGRAPDGDHGVIKAGDRISHARTIPDLATKPVNRR